MSALIPPAQRPRKPGIPSPRLEIPQRSTSGTPKSSSSSDDATSTESAGPGGPAPSLPVVSQEPDTSSQAINGSSASSSSAQPPLRPPKLSLPSLNVASRSEAGNGHNSLSVAAGFENLSLDDKTLRPGLIPSPVPPMPAPIPHVAHVASNGRPKLALSATPSRTASPAPQVRQTPSLSIQKPRASPQLDLFAISSSSSSSSISSSMTRSTSYEGALIAETSSAIVNDQEYKLSSDSLKDLGRLGEGASGEVRKVLHKPSNIIMAKKVRSSLAVISNAIHKLVSRLPADHSSIIG